MIRPLPEPKANDDGTVFEGAIRESRRPPEDRRRGQEVARQYTVEAIDTLAAIMRDKKAPAAARAMACNSILDRGYGRPFQAVSTTISARSVNELSDQELMAIIAGGAATTTEH